MKKLTMPHFKPSHHDETFLPMRVPASAHWRSDLCWRLTDTPQL